MSLSDGRYWISFNGEIYNHVELRAWLIEQGIHCQTNSDTEVILQLYKLEGANCVRKLRGMFALVIWDEIAKVGFIARDPMGIKPLYYHHDGSSLIVASELRAIVASDLVDTTVNESAKDGYLQRGTVQEPSTLIKDVHMLQAGSSLLFDQKGIHKDQYWVLNFPSTKGSNSMSRDQAVALTRSALFDSVKAHLVSDVPVGIFLSGGIDSTALVAIASQLSSAPINTFSISFDDPKLNEGDLAKRVADQFGTNHTELRMTPELALPLFNSFLDKMDQPTIDGFNTYCVSKLAHDRGAKVVLSGLGADEIFGGYKSFDLIPKILTISKWGRIISPLTRPLLAPLNRLLPAKYRRLLDLIHTPYSIAAAHKSLRGIFSDQEIRSLTNSITNSDLNAQNDTPLTGLRLADGISKLELEIYLRNQLLRDSDVMSMAWGLELRVPFVDQLFIDSILTIPTEHRIATNKQLLIDALPEIPEWITNRPKQGFVFPFDTWFEKEWRQIKLATDVPKWIALSPWSRRWSLTVLSYWTQKYTGISTINDTVDDANSSEA